MSMRIKIEGCVIDTALVFFVKQMTAYELRISDWSSDVCSSDLGERRQPGNQRRHARAGARQLRLRQDHAVPRHRRDLAVRSRFGDPAEELPGPDRKSTRLNSSH